MKVKDLGMESNLLKPASEDGEHQITRLKIDQTSDEGKKYAYSSSLQFKSEIITYIGRWSKGTSSSSSFSAKGFWDHEGQMLHVWTMDYPV